MILLLLILATICTSAQSVGDGVPLLRQVSEASRTAKGWRASGGLDVKAGLPGASRQFDFEESRGFMTSKRGPLESHDNSGRGETVCDGSTRWNRLLSVGNGHAWESMKTATAEECDPSALRWGNLLDSLRSAVLLGAAGTSPACTVVRAEYTLPKGPGFWIPTFHPVGLITREMCIDEPRKVILWERFEGTSSEGVHVMVSMTYNEIERDPEFGVDEFEIPNTGCLGCDDGPIWNSVQLLDIDLLPAHICTGSSPSVGCSKLPFPF